MGEIVDLPRKHIVVSSQECVHVICITDIREIASGRTSVAEYKEPEIFAQALALIVLEYLDDR